MLIIERVVALGACPMFRGLPDHVLAEVAAIATELAIEPGEVLITEGRDESWMFVLVDGSAVGSFGGTEVATFGSGDTIGELAVLDPAPRSATVVATEPSLLLRIDHAALVDLLLDQPDLATGIITVLTRRLRETTLRVTGEGGRPVPDIIW